MHGHARGPYQIGRALPLCTSLQLQQYVIVLLNIGKCECHERRLVDGFGAHLTELNGVKFIALVLVVHRHRIAVNNHRISIRAAVRRGVQYVATVGLDVEADLGP